MVEQSLIRDITTYTTNWIIIARVVEKSPLNTLKNNNKLFYIDIVDKLVSVHEFRAILYEQNFGGMQPINTFHFWNLEKSIPFPKAVSRSQIANSILIQTCMN